MSDDHDDDRQSGVRAARRDQMERMDHSAARDVLSKALFGDKAVPSVEPSTYRRREWQGWTATTKKQKKKEKQQQKQKQQQGAEQQGRPSPPRPTTSARSNFGGNNYDDVQAPPLPEQDWRHSTSFRISAVSQYHRPIPSPPPLPPLRAVSGGEPSRTSASASAAKEAAVNRARELLVDGLDVSHGDLGVDMSEDDLLEAAVAAGRAAGASASASSFAPRRRPLSPPPSELRRARSADAAAAYARRVRKQVDASFQPYPAQDYGRHDDSISASESRSRSRSHLAAPHFLSGAAAATAAAMSSTTHAGRSAGRQGGGEGGGGDVAACRRPWDEPDAAVPHAIEAERNFLWNESLAGGEGRSTWRSVGRGGGGGGDDDDVILPHRRGRGAEEGGGLDPPSTGIEDWSSPSYYEHKARFAPSPMPSLTPQSLQPPSLLSGASRDGTVHPVESDSPMREYREREQEAARSWYPSAMSPVLSNILNSVRRLSTRDIGGRGGRWGEDSKCDEDEDEDEGSGNGFGSGFGSGLGGGSASDPGPSRASRRDSPIKMLARSMRKITLGDVVSDWPGWGWSVGSSSRFGSSRFGSRGREEHAEEKEEEAGPSRSRADGLGTSKDDFTDTGRTIECQTENGISDDGSVAMLPIGMYGVSRARRTLLCVAPLAIVLAGALLLSVHLRTGSDSEPAESPETRGGAEHMPPSGDVRMDEDAAFRYGRILERIVVAGVTSPLALVGTECSTPQLCALNWISNEDPARLDPDDEYLLQRYACATFWFSTFEMARLRNAKKFPHKEDSGPNWSNQSNWMTGKGICAWYGVTCHHRPGTDPSEVTYDADGGVTGLNLTANEVRGVLAPELFTILTDVRNLFLADNALTGVVPNVISRMRKLERLYIWGNYLDGSLPSGLGELKELRDCYAQNNLLNGQLPSQLGQLTKLQNLGLHMNYLSGTLPSALAKMKQLRLLYLDSNYFSGQIPPSLFANLVNAQDVRLGNNRFSGAIPNTVIAMANTLEVLDLKSNSLTGSLPTEFGALRQLSGLHLSNNAIGGALVSELGELAGLVRLHLENNLLNGTIPAVWGNGIHGLRELHLGQNRLHGRIPPDLAGMEELRDLRLHDNELSGAIPKRLGTMFNLEILRLENNALQGRIPEQLSHLDSLKEMTLHMNTLLGVMPHDVCVLREANVLEVLIADCAGGGSATPPVMCDCCTGCWDGHKIVSSTSS